MAFNTLTLSPDNGFEGDTIELSWTGSADIYGYNFNGEDFDLGDVQSSPFSIVVPPGSGSVEVYLLGVLLDRRSDIVTFTYNVTPISNICFLGDTPITTDQGKVAIEDIDPDLYTIDGEPILAISKTKSKDYLVCFEKHALYNNVPSQRTIMSKTHKVAHLGKMKEAHRFCNITDKVYKIPYEGQTLYNVLMEKHRTMKVNNLTCETLNPKNEMAKYFLSTKRLNK